MRRSRSKSLNRAFGGAFGAATVALLCSAVAACFGLSCADEASDGGPSNEEAGAARPPAASSSSDADPARGDAAPGGNGDGGDAGSAHDASPDARAFTTNIVFLSKRQSSGAFGGLDGGDGICREEAADAGLPGDFVAYLSGGGVDAIERLAGSRGWVRPDGRPVTDTTADLAAGKIVFPPILSAWGARLNNLSAWTGSAPDGTLSPEGFTCSDWTSSSSSENGIVGQSFAGDTTVSSLGGGSCADPRPLYCMSVGKNVAISAPPQVPGRRAFVTVGKWPNGGGLAGADAFCQAEAGTLPGTFRALLAGVGTSAASRFDTSGLPWVRADGLALSATAATFFTERDLPIQFSADGLTRFGGTTFYWFGASSPTATGTADTTCTGWTVTTGTQTEMTLGWGVHTAIWGLSTNYACTTAPMHLVCLQE